MGHAPDTLDHRLASPGRIASGRRARSGTTRLGNWLARLRPAAPESPPAAERPASPLLRTATPLLALMLRLPGLAPPANLEGLRHRIIAALRRFQSAARAAQVPADQMRAAHFILCAALDDIIAATAWGRQAGWSERGLIRTFHKAIEPGPSFATLLAHIQATPAEHLDELELVAICMALGFEGATRGQPQGRDAFRRLRDDIHRTIVQERGPSAPDLSPQWRGVPAPPPPLGTVLPVWVTACLAGLLLTGLYILLAFSLGAESDRAFQRLAGLLPDRPALIAHLQPPPPAPPRPSARADTPEAAAGTKPVAEATKPAEAKPEPAPPPAAPEPSTRAKRFQTALAKEAAAGLVEVVTGASADILRIAGAAAFTRNGDTLSRPGHDLAEHLAAVLDHEPGRILVVGHTDDGFEPNLRFASSLALTEARARAIARVLVAHLSAPERVDIEGRADTEPLVPNTGPANRERNRRVEIILAAGETGR